MRLARDRFDRGFQCVFRDSVDMWFARSSRLCFFVAILWVVFIITLRPFGWAGSITAFAWAQFAGLRRVFSGDSFLGRFDLPQELLGQYCWDPNRPIACHFGEGGHADSLIQVLGGDVPRVTWVF